MTGTVQNRSIKEIYIADYDGERQTPRHDRPHAEHRAALVARRPFDRVRRHAVAAVRDLFISNIFQGTLDEVTKGDKVGENWLPAWSPDGTKLRLQFARATATRRSTS